MTIVEVHNLAIGGTGTPVGTAMIKYWMLPQDLAKIGPDVIINSYSTNDSLQHNKTDIENWIHVMDDVRDRLQTFIREALQSRRCGVPPLVVHVDDYVGPIVDYLLSEISYSLQMTQLARWYDTVGISYGEVVRDIIYQDKLESTFGNKRDVHYGHWAHQTIAWSVGFASLELIINFCDDEYNLRIAQQKVSGSTSSTAGLPDDTDSLKKMIKNNRLFLPPPLTKELKMTDVTHEFETSLNKAQQLYAKNNCNSYNGTDVEDKNPCIASWISWPGLYGAGQINSFMRTYGILNQGWTTELDMAEGWGNKVGYIATVPNATFSLNFKNIAKKVNTVSIYFIRSYGEKWENSRVKISILTDVDNSNEGSILAEKEISGIFDDENVKVSLTLSETLELIKTVTIGETITVRVDLIGGSHFKIMGIMICE